MATFRSILNELKKLEEDGIKVRAWGKMSTKKCMSQWQLCLEIGVSEVLGLTPGFSRYHVCRFCTVSKELIRTQTQLDYVLLRTRDNHDQHLSQVLIDGEIVVGVKEPSIWNELRAFHSIENLFVDLPPDLAEGVCGYVMAPIIKNLIAKNRFRMITLNNRIEAFNYGSVEASNKPPLVTESSR